MTPDRGWYREGLRFGCTRCGACCRGAGNVWVDDDEIVRLASRLAMTEDELRTAFTRRARGGTVLRQKRNRDCVFLGASGCTVYADRPRQCRSYPFWRGVVHSRERWEEEAASCPGIGTGELVPAREIERLARDDGIPAHRTRLRVPGS